MLCEKVDAHNSGSVAEDLEFGVFDPTALCTWQTVKNASGTIIASGVLVSDCPETGNKSLLQAHRDYAGSAVYEIITFEGSHLGQWIPHVPSLDECNMLREILTDEVDMLPPPTTREVVNRNLEKLKLRLTELNFPYEVDPSGGRLWIIAPGAQQCHGFSGIYDLDVETGGTALAGMRVGYIDPPYGFKDMSTEHPHVVRTMRHFLFSEENM